MTSTPTPIQQPTVTYKTVSSSEVQSLSRDDLSQAFKNILLRSYVERVITDNENLGVTTDVSIVDMQTHHAVVSHNLDTEQFAASINKLPVTALVLADLRSGKLQMNQTLTWTAGDVRAGAGVYDQPGAPLQASLQDVLFDMLNRSGNTAVRALVNGVLGGATAVNGRFSDELQLAHTYLQPLDAAHFYLGNSTARDSLSVMQHLMVPSDSYSAFVKNALATNIYTDFGVRSQLAGNDYIVLVNKVGILNDPDGNNRHDVGLIYNTHTHKTYGYSFMTTAPGEAEEPPTVQGNSSLMDMGTALLRAAGDKAPKQRTHPMPLATPQAEKRVLY